MTITELTAGVRPRRTRRRLVRAILAAVAVVGAVAATAGPASAAQTCTGHTDSNLCFAIDGLGNNMFHVHVGIDVHMPLDQAQEYIDDTGDPFVVWIDGVDDGRLSETKFSVPITDLGASSESGLSADFDRDVPGSWLNEDNPGGDELKAEVLLIDRDLQRTDNTYVSNELDGNFQ
jgi:hypothetical protein